MTEFSGDVVPADRYEGSPLTISVTIPAHDEEAEIADVIGRVLAQGDAILEVIVVDNNSTDRTAEIVAGIAVDDPRVVLLPESKPGVAYARYAGFDAARGDLIASVDADTRLEPGWADAIVRVFAAHPEIDAGGAPMLMHDLPLQWLYAPWQRALVRRAEAALARGEVQVSPGLSGANSVLRASAWKLVREKVSYDRCYFEDMDRTLHLRSAGCTLAIVPGMAATVSGRRRLSSIASFRRYARAMPRTYRLHGRTVAAAACEVGVALQLVSHTVLLPVNRAWDPDARRFSPRRLRRRAPSRVEPVG